MELLAARWRRTPKMGRVGMGDVARRGEERDAPASEVWSWTSTSWRRAARAVAGNGTAATWGGALTPFRLGAMTFRPLIYAPGNVPCLPVPRSLFLWYRFTISYVFVNLYHRKTRVTLGLTTENMYEYCRAT